MRQSGRGAYCTLICTLHTIQVEVPLVPYSESIETGDPAVTELSGSGLTVNIYIDRYISYILDHLHFGLLICF